MTNLPDEKKFIIRSLLDKLRQYNPSIGTYVASMMNENFIYSVKLSNGRIEIPEDLIHDFEHAPTHIGADRYISTAGKFLSDAPVVTPETIVPPKQNSSQNLVNAKPKKRRWILWVLLILFFLIGVPVSSPVIRQIKIREKALILNTNSYEENTIHGVTDCGYPKQA